MQSAGSAAPGHVGYAADEPATLVLPKREQGVWKWDCYCALHPSATSFIQIP